MDTYKWLVEQEQDLLYLVEQAYGRNEMSEQQYQPGDPIWWNWQQYLSGYAPQVIAVFVMKRNTAKKNAGIAVKMSNGSWQPKWVAIENIERREV